MNAWDQRQGVSAETFSAAEQRLREGVPLPKFRDTSGDAAAANYIPGALVPPDTPLPIPATTIRATLADFRFRADFQPSGQHVRFGGPGGFWEATVIKGSLEGLIGFGLKQLARPSGLVGQVQRGNFKVYAPRWTKFNPGAGAVPDKDGLFLNRKDHRRILIIEGRAETAVFRFGRKIPQRLLLALKALFTGKMYEIGQPGLQSLEQDDEPFEEGDPDGPR